MEKKKYIKPVVMVEDFTLSQCIASCANIIEAADYNCIKNHYGEDDLIIGIGGFVEKFVCDINAEEMENDTYCYHTLEGQNIMNS